MSFFDLLNALLTTLDIPYYEGQPEFEGEWPELFLSYNVYDNPVHWGCGVECGTKYVVTLNIYAKGADRAQTAGNTGIAIDSLLTENGFFRISGSFGLSDDFPQYYHRIVEYCYIQIKE